MVRIAGPLFSVQAQGTYRNEVTFRSSSGVQHAYQKPTRTAGWSAVQASHRAALADMAATWRGYAPATRAAWAAAATVYTLTGYAYHWREWVAQASTPASPPVIP